MGYRYTFDIAGVEYGMSDVASAKIEHPLFDKLSVGNTCSAELDITFWPKADVPKMAKIIPAIVEEADVIETFLGDGLDAGTYSFDIPNHGRHDIIFFEEHPACQVTVTVGKSGYVKAIVQNYSWFGGGLGDPYPLGVSANANSTAPALTDFAGTIEITTAEVAIPLGVFWTDTRAAFGDALNIIAYDAMMKAGIVWVPDQSLEFPMSMPDAVAEICRLMDVELDSRTMLNNEYYVDYPANDYTLRDVLGFIAAAHAGNWTFTRDGKLLLVPLLGAVTAETNCLVTENGDTITFGGVSIVV
jgi:hypothetical protein